ncbi:hypothetical Protein YC6258_03511 [Gynuella sunshinyii YC6258]|uniref:Uncharacterized protein n=1 Tax=Gynuella sunshinyii YC6258 TaxID=1445510 RepID=A0A0C5VLF9_9GAMM|nr:hypothetical Protein YC6258_03511 [Gynuella sunshinyii YC6258]
MDARDTAFISLYFHDHHRDTQKQGGCYGKSSATKYQTVPGGYFLDTRCIWFTF